ncbi:MAG: APC family permease [Actinomycetota bacterium]
MTSGPPASGSLKRQLGVSDAVIIGAGSMIGAGVFAAWSPAARAAGDGLLIGLAIAGVVAFCNAASSAQLAAIHPQSGGTYVYGRHQLGAFWGHLAGWGFVVGKTASCAAMALTVGVYLTPEQPRPTAVLAIVMITAVNLGGLTRTVAVTRILLAVSLTALAVIVYTAVGYEDERALALVGPGAGEADLPGVLQSAGFLFFAFAGYARIATLGEEVRDPARTIPIAIPTALVGVLALYAVVGVVMLGAVGADRLATTSAPLRTVFFWDDRLEWVVQIGAGIASLGVLLNLIPGVSRTTLAMARNRDLPGWFAHVDGVRSIPLRAELTVASVVTILVLTLDIRSSIAVSGVAVLTYYAVTNAAALTLTAEQRRWPRVIPVLGFAGCVILVLALPGGALAGGALVLGLGVIAGVVARGRT